MSQKRRFGVVLLYVVAMIVLGVLLIGGVYFMKRDWRAPEATPSPVVTNDPQVPADAPKGTEKPSEDTSAEQKNTNSESQQPTHLPQTGPDGSLVRGLALSAMVAVIVAYLQSRRYRAVF